MAVVKGVVAAAVNLTAANQAATVRVGGADALGIQVTGTFVGTLTFESTIDGTTWVAHTVRDTATVADGTRVASTTAPGNFTVDLPIVKLFRVRCSAYTSGTAVVITVKSLR